MKVFLFHFVFSLLSDEWGKGASREKGGRERGDTGQETYLSGKQMLMRTGEKLIVPCEIFGVVNYKPALSPQGKINALP